MKGGNQLESPRSNGQKMVLNREQNIAETPVIKQAQEECAS